MRSTGFVVLSFTLHVMCAFALTMAPIRTISSDTVGDNKIEVKLNEVAEQPGTPQAEPPKEIVQPQAAAEPAPAPEPAKPVEKTVKAVKVKTVQPVKQAAATKRAPAPAKVVSPVPARVPVRLRVVPVSAA